ncbi:hypothetical protein PG988_013846 [Apiospora saccharicola]
MCRGECFIEREKYRKKRVCVWNTADNPHFSVVADYYNSHAIPNSRYQIWIAHNNPVTRDGLWCVTGGRDDRFYGNEQFQAPGIGAEGTYYDTIPYTFS